MKVDFSTKINKGTFMPAPTLPPLTSPANADHPCQWPPQFHQMPLNFIRCPSISTDAPQFHPLPSTAAHCCPLLPTAAHCCPLLPTAAHCCPLLPTAAHCCPLPSTATHCCPLLPPDKCCPVAPTAALQPLPSSAHLQVFPLYRPVASTSGVLSIPVGNVWHNFRLGFNGSSFLGSGFPFHHHQSASYYDVSKELFSPMIPCYSLP